MRKILIFAFLLIFGLAAAAGAEGLWIDKKWCADVDGNTYCMEFEQGPFGPGLCGNAELTWTESDAVLGPVQKTVDAGSYSQRESGDLITFHDLDLKARVFGKRLIFYQEVLTLRWE